MNCFFDTETLQFLIANTEKYAQDVKGDHSFTLDEDTLKVSFAILLLSGYAVLPRRRMYCEQQADVWNEAVATAMPRKSLKTCGVTFISLTTTIFRRMTGLPK